MKTRRIYIEKNKIEEDGSGCCGSTSQRIIEMQPVQSSCCGTVSQIEEQSQIRGGCCG